MLELSLRGLQEVFHFYNFLFLVVGTFLGMIIGALPGLTATMGLALLIPMTFTMTPGSGLIMLGGLAVGSMYADAIPACLINTPGTPACIATTFDGYPLTKKGMAQHGLVTAAFASAYGSFFGTIILITSSPFLAKISLKFGPPEYFWLAIFGLTIISTLTTDFIFKGLLGGAIGLLISTVGIAPIGGDPRFTFGFPPLQAGIHLIVALIGFFCLSEILNNVVGKRQKKYVLEDVPSEISVIFRVIKSLLKKPVLMIRSSLIGTIIGVAPGAGGNIASFVSYNEAVRWDKNPEEFGKGTIKGVAASEAANSAMVPASLIPLLTLGIPGSPIAAVMLGALLIHGLRPGYELFTTESAITYAFMTSLFVAALLVTVVGCLGSIAFSKIITIPARFLGPPIVFMTVIGSYAIRNNMFDVWIMLLFGVLGIISTRLKLHPGPIVLGFILGPYAEEGIVQSALVGMAEGGVLKYLVLRPISMILIVMSIVSALWPLYASWRKGRKPRV